MAALISRSPAAALSGSTPRTASMAAFGRTPASFQRFSMAAFDSRPEAADDIFYGARHATMLPRIARAARYPTKARAWLASRDVADAHVTGISFYHTSQH